MDENRDSYRLCGQLKNVTRKVTLVERQVPIPIEYSGVRFDEGFRADIVVEGKVILELKSLEKIRKVHKKQLLTYLNLSGLKLGFLLHFGEVLMKEGITRIVNGLDEN